MPEIIALTNQKGGVGKTTTAVNLAACLATTGQKVLLIDLDPQANATSGFGLAKKNISKSIYEVLLAQEELQSILIPTQVKGLSLAPSGLALAGAGIELTNLPQREKRLTNALHGFDQNYQWVFIDCPPSLGLLTINGLMAAHRVIMPIQCEYYALEGLGDLLKTLVMVKRNLNPQLEIEGILLTMFDVRTNLSEQVAREVKKFFGGKVFETVIPRNVRLAEAPSFGKPISLYDPNCPGAIAYMNLARELKNKR